MPTRSAFAAIYGLDVVTARVSSVYGPNTRFNTFRGLVGNTLIAHVCQAVAFGEAVTLEGGGDCPRDWTYAADAALGVCLAYYADIPRHTVYNIASGRNHTVAEVIAAIHRIAPEARVHVGSGRSEENPSQAGNLRGTLDIRRAREDLGYAPRYDLEAGLREYIAWWKRVGDRRAVSAS